MVLFLIGLKFRYLSAVVKFLSRTCDCETRAAFEICEWEKKEQALQGFVPCENFEYTI